ncbi:MAG: hypothetical protein KDF64_05735 [Geminicoccaceae bacterium]|nr:hypothetical protein [Geminicoccaceae bacterium]
MNAKNRSMYPYRRGSGKRRNKPATPRRGGGNQRRPAGSAAELLPLLQPTTKALAQMLAGNTKASGQLVHARNMLEQAQRMIDDRHVDRMQPAMREEFLEQVARLRLTLSDADDLLDAADADGPDDGNGEAGENERAPKTAPVTMDRLRELALSLAGPASTTDPADQPSAHERLEAIHADREADAVHELRESIRKDKAAGETVQRPSAEERPATERAGKTREKLRLKTVTYLPGD